MNWRETVYMIGYCIFFEDLSCAFFGECRLPKNSKRQWNQAMRKSWKKPWTRQSCTQSAQRPGKTVAAESVLHAATLCQWLTEHWMHRCFMIFLFWAQIASKQDQPVSSSGGLQEVMEAMDKYIVGGLGSVELPLPPWKRCLFCFINTLE